MPDLDPSCPRGAGGSRRPPRFISHSRFAVALLLCAALTAASSASATVAPRLRALLKAGRTVVAGAVTDSVSYDDDRVAVVTFKATKVFRGKGEPPLTLSLVELHEGSNAPPMTAGMQGLAFLRPAAMTSYLERTIPAGSYEQLLPDYGAFIPAADSADAARQVAIMARVLRAASGAPLSAADARQLTFDLLASDSPVLVEDGAAGLGDLGRPATLTEAESATLSAALLRQTLPDRVRIGLIRAVADAQLTAMVPTLQKIDTPPPVMEAAWRALDTLGAGAAADELKQRLASTAPSTRIAAARAMLDRSGADAVVDVSPLAVRDPDPKVRLAVVEALGALKNPATLPTLEQAFVDPDVTQRQAAARAILAVGGKSAADTLSRLAVEGPVESQRYAVVVLMTMNDPDAAVLLKQLGKTHPDAKTRDLIQHGFPKPEH
jgi:HEAT repeat protein